MGMIKTSTRLEGWLKYVGWINDKGEPDYKKLAKELNYDEAFIAAMLKGTAEPSKVIMRKLLDLTCMGMELFEYDRSVEPKNDNDK